MKFLKKDKNIQINESVKKTETLLKKYSSVTPDELYNLLDSKNFGLSSEQVEEKIDEYGFNVITVGKKNNIWNRLADAVINPFNIVLFVIALITYFTDVVLTSEHDYLTVFIILFIILVSSLVAFIQGEQSNSAAQKLSKMITNKILVLRDGKYQEVPFEEVVIGDVIKFSAGDMIPADVRFISTKDTFVAQAALTGESNPVEKFNILKENNSSITDLSNIGFMGSNIVSGSAVGIVLATGNDTYFGSMAKTLSGNRAETNFERGVNSVSKLLIKYMIIMVPIVFVINVITKGDWVESLLFSVTIAVGLTPEMLPVIMTSTLAKGAISMSKHKTIVKNLGSIQSFGEMDILCTDKTGTLTEDKIILEKYMDVKGADDKRILRHAYFNSYFQTGLKNLIDIAIISRAESYKFDEILSNYECVDEIPFDFSRRRMSVVLKDKNNKRQLITKGAVEEIMSVCNYVEYDGQILPLDENLKKEAMATYNLHNTDGLRMLAVAQKNNVSDIDRFGINDENDMVLIGFIGFLDPPKESAKKAIDALKHHGVKVIVLTGDSEGVALKVCSKVGIDTNNNLLGSDIEKMNDQELSKALDKCHVVSKLSPIQKQRIVKILQEQGHTVGYMGDGINDAPSISQADVGISVDSGVDIAKETADIILLEKDLMVLEEGVIEGRKTFGNIMKYIKMAASGNLGNIVSVIVASIFLPFLPILPIQLLTQNLLCDFSQMAMPFDSVDKEYLLKPRKWEMKSLKIFMLVMGPLSSVFDIMCFAVLWWIIGANNYELAPLFHSGWFVFGTVSQILVIHTIRTAKIPFIQSNASKPFIISTGLVSIISLIIGFTNLAGGLDMAKLPLTFVPWLVFMLAAYCISTQIFKKLYIKLFGEWL